MQLKWFIGSFTEGKVWAQYNTVWHNMIQKRCVVRSVQEEKKWGFAYHNCKALPSRSYRCVLKSLMSVTSYKEHPQHFLLQLEIMWHFLDKICFFPFQKFISPVPYLFLLKKTHQFFHPAKFLIQTLWSLLCVAPLLATLPHNSSNDGRWISCSLCGQQ